MIDASTFADIQQALIIIFSPFFLWGLVLLIAGSVLLALSIPMFSLIRSLMKMGG